ncbi:unnamed protein product, partial [Mesorhabditis belari]|uniref:Uncharacterized protein n=1 Tax=Mesorhabditis belari TaxID=2138241 RepID=A0AAF3F000_9BILA
MICEENETITARELNHIFEAERELVLKTQENYRQLKRRFFEVKEELLVVKEENNELKSRHGNSEKLERNFADLEKKSRDLIEKLEEEGKEREIKNEIFRTTKLEELRKVFQKELLEEEKRYGMIMEEKKILMEMNEKLEENLCRQKSVTRQSELDAREKEKRLRDHFVEETNKILKDLEREGPISSHDSQLVEGYRKEITVLEEKCREFDEKLRESRQKYENYLESLNREMREERMEKEKRGNECKRLTNSLRIQKEMIRLKDGEIEILQKKINSILKEKMERENENLQNEQRHSINSDRLGAEFAEKFSLLEGECLKKNMTILNLRDEITQNRQEIEGLLGKIEEKDKVAEKMKKNEFNSQKQRQQFEAEMEKMRKNCENEKIRHEKMEETILILRNQFETSPETITRVKKLEKLLIEKEDTNKALRQHYRDLLKRMKQSLISLEKKHSRAQQKLANHILL